MSTSGKSSRDVWGRDSGLVADLVAAGQFKMAMHILKRTIGVKNYAPLKPLFLRLYTAVQPSLPTMSNGGGQYSIDTALLRKDTKLPLLPLTLQAAEEELKNGLQAFTSGKFNDSLTSGALVVILNVLVTVPIVKE